MTETPACTRCGKEVQGRFGGLCPRCAFQFVLQPEPAQEGVQFGNYRLLGVLGTGGMGIVYRARQKGLERTVALKMLPAAQDTPAELVERFFREARAAASLRHPNIVPIHEVSSHEGTYYYSMELIEGRTLSTQFREQPLRDSLEIIRKVALAVHHAHEAGIIHRDLKPANVMVDAAGEPKILDFGVAKIASTKAATLEGCVLGTPSYMSPEQAGGVTDIDARADVYSLGAVLYECLTGRPPHAGESALEVLGKIQSETVASPSRFNPKVDARLEAVCLKALRKRRESRYASARALAEDLQRYLQGRPIEAEPRPRPRWARWIAAGLFVAAIGGVWLATRTRPVSEEDVRRAYADIKAADPLGTRDLLPPGSSFSARTPVPGMFTRKGYDEYAKPAIRKEAARLAKKSGRPAGEFEAAMNGWYGEDRDQARAAFLAGLDLKPFSDATAALDAIVSGDEYGDLARLIQVELSPAETSAESFSSKEITAAARKLRSYMRILAPESTLVQRTPWIARDWESLEQVLERAKISAPLRSLAERLFVRVWEAHGASIASWLNRLWREKTKTVIDARLDRKFPFAAAADEELSPEQARSCMGILVRFAEDVVMYNQWTLAGRPLLDLDPDFRNLIRLAQFYRAAFDQKGNPDGVRFDLRADSLPRSPGVTEIRVTLDGPVFDLKNWIDLMNRPMSKTGLVWKPGSVVSLEFGLFDKKEERLLSFEHRQGAWGLLRLLSAGKAEPQNRREIVTYWPLPGGSAVQLIFSFANEIDFAIPTKFPTRVVN